MINIDQTRRRTDVTEFPHDEIRADNQIARDLALHSEVYVYRGGTGQVPRNHETLLVRFDVGDRKVPIVRIAPRLGQLRANGGQNLQYRGARE